MELQLPLFETPTSWTPPAHLPDLRSAKLIAIDTETHDPNLKSTGPGYIRGDGHVAGISIAADTGFCGYFPIGHAAGGNLDRTVVAGWLAEQCAHPDTRYLFANAQYDLGWLRTVGVEVKGKVSDVCIADTMLDEERNDGYSLAAIAHRHLGTRKDERLLREAAANWGLKDPKGDLWKLPANLVGRIRGTGRTDHARPLVAA